MAAGKGTRMKSDLAKVLHKVHNRAMIHYVIDQAKSIGSKRIITIIGHQKEKVREELKNSGVEFSEQNEQLGTGHAVMQTEPLLMNFSGDVLVLSGDVPLLTSGTLLKLIGLHYNTCATASLLTAELENPFGYGRIIRNKDGFVERIIEEKDASDEEKRIKEINVGLYVFKSPDLFYALKEIKPDNKQGEYYLPDVIKIFHRDNKKIAAFLTKDFDETRGINTIEQLKEAEIILKRR
jgi:UDP-N-acetylglucosamine diphosphorylase/glucosamine-1-phosphate N-acetyltransferase